MARLGRPCALLLGLALLLPAARPGRSDLSLIRLRPRPDPDPDQNQDQNQDPPEGPAASASPAPGPAFALKVQVKDAGSRQPLRRAAVQVFVNRTRTCAAVTGSRGAVLLRVPFAPGLGLTVLAHKAGYALAPLAWQPGRMPVYSSLTLSLFPQSPANIWLFEDTVLITGKMAEARSQPRVQFPKAAIALPDSHHFSNVTGYLSVLQQFLRADGALYASGVTLSKAGSESVELAPLAAVCVKMFSGARELQVAGPARLSLPLAHARGLRAGDRVPAWTFDMDTGAWVSRGHGSVQPADSHFAWTYDAPHLGYWIAARLPGAGGPGAGGDARDVAADHAALLTATLGGTVLVVAGFFALLPCYCRDRCGRPRKRDRTLPRPEALRRDQTTSTTHIHRIGAAQDRPLPRGAGSPARSPQRPGPEGRVAVVRTLDPLRLYGEDGACPPARPEAQPGAPQPHGGARPPAAAGEGPPPPRLCRPPLALLRSADLLAPEPGPAALRAAPLPRRGGPGASAQTLPAAPGPAEEAGAPGPAPAPAWARFPGGRLESLSEPERALRRLSPRGGPRPRAWFVSLDGAPAAPVRRSFLDPRRGRHGASLDSGVDLRERPERARAPGPAGPDPAPSSSGSGAAVCSPDDPAPRPAGRRAPAAAPEASPPGKRRRAPRAQRGRDGEAGVRRKREERPLLPVN